MNKILKAFMMIAVMAVALTGCREDAELASTGAPQNPEKEIVGVYTGTWTIENTTTGAVSTFDGTLTFEDAGKAYTANVTAFSQAGDINLSAPANVTKTPTEYKYFNEIASNSFGCIFSGTISKTGEATIGFKQVRREGRKSYVFIFTFVGQK